MSHDSLPGMNQVIAANRIEIRIGKKSEGVAGFLTKVARLFGAVDADRDRANSGLVKSVKIFLNAPQLGVT